MSERMKKGFLGGVLTGAGLAGVFMYLVCPGGRRHKDIEKLNGAMIAHRGFHDLTPGTPENSLPAFRQAVEAGFPIENDIHLTADGEVVVFHDDSLLRMCGVEGKVEEMTLAELKELRLGGTNETIPTLRECLDVVDGKVFLLIEFKCLDRYTCEALCEAANEILSKYQGSYMIQSFYPFVLSWYRKNRKDICRGQLSCRFSLKEDGLSRWLLGNLLLNFLGRPDFVSYRHEDYDQPLRKLCTVLGGFPVGWTFHSMDEVKARKKEAKTFIFEGFDPRNAEQEKEQ